MQKNSLAKQLLSISLFIVLFLNVSFSKSETKNSPCMDDANYPNVTKLELKQLIAENKVFLVDANSKSSFEEIKIANAIHFGSYEGNFASILPPDKNRLIVAYCGGPLCTAWKKPARAACALGYTQVKHFKEGIKGWQKD